MERIKTNLKDLVLAPYIVKASILIRKKRRMGGNLFRHQFDTLGILLNYRYIDPVLLKAAVIHDLFEDAPDNEGVSREAIEKLDSDGAKVYLLVMEVTRRQINGQDESKKDFLLRIMQTGTSNAKVLKMADRISNLVSGDYKKKIKKTLIETKKYILPYSKAVNPAMYKELDYLVKKKERTMNYLTGLWEAVHKLKGRKKQVTRNT